MGVLQKFSPLDLSELMRRPGGVREEVWAPLSGRNGKNDLPTDTAGSCQRKPGCELSAAPHCLLSPGEPPAHMGTGHTDICLAEDIHKPLFFFLLKSYLIYTLSQKNITIIVGVLSCPQRETLLDLTQF